MRYVAQHARSVPVAKGLDLHLHGTPTVKRALLPQHVALHEALVAAAKHQAHCRALELVVYGDLQLRGKRRIRLCGIGELVEHE